MPFSLLTGFLGSGKTTLLNWLLRHPSLSDTAVAINEFGAIPLDHVFVESPTDDVIVLANGCMCCFATDDLEASLTRIFRRSDAGELPSFKRLIIETSGLADPEFVLQSILDSPIAARFLWLDRIVTTVDALHGAHQLEQHPEARKQARLADKIIITKTDLANPVSVDALQDRLSSLNGRAEQLLRQDITLDIDQIFSPIFINENEQASLIGEWVKRDSRLSASAQTGHGHNHRHAPSAVSTTLTADVPINWREFHLWLGREQRKFGDRLLRVKGIVNAWGSAEPVVVHAVQSTLHVPVSLKAWPDADRRSRIVFIFTGDHAEKLRESWELFLQTAAPSAASADL
nr:GTP-binding protein [Sphingomonas sp. CDS-1]